MNHGVPSSSSNAVFLVKCADCKRLAVRSANGRWKSFYDDAELPDNTEAVMAVPIELILPFLPEIKRVQLCPAQSPEQKITQTRLP
jgi:hypothetical protein